MWHGVATLDLTQAVYGPFEIELPLLVQWMYQWTHAGAVAPDVVVFSQLNAYFVAGWFGLIVTGLNMVPMGQLDGGHVSYTLFGTAAHWIARTLMVLVIAYQVYTQSAMFVLMLVLIMVVGLEHPPTRDDTVRLGPVRWCIGVVSLTIPVLCLAPSIIIMR
jgi:membrane-associated protease RseP (regulator of RpoE activity)